MAVVRILGIDPGTQVVGFGCLDLHVGPAAAPSAATPLALRAANTLRAGGAGELRLVGAGVLRLGGRQHTVAQRLLALADQLRELLRTFAPTEVALEEAFYGKSVQAALRIGEARGVVLAEAARAGLDIHQYPPARIKRCVTGNGDASKAAVAAMVQNQLGALAVALGAAVPADATDALAAGLTRAEERRSPLLQAEVLALAVGEGAGRSGLGRPRLGRGGSGRGGRGGRAAVRPPEPD